MFLAHTLGLKKLKEYSIFAYNFEISNLKCCIRHKLGVYYEKNTIIYVDFEFITEGFRDRMKGESKLSKEEIMTIFAELEKKKEYLERLINSQKNLIIMTKGMWRRLKKYCSDRFRLKNVLLILEYRKLLYIRQLTFN